MNMKNPIFNSIEKDGDIENNATMTGITSKTAILLAITVVSALAIMITGYYNYFLLIITGIIGVIAVIQGRTNPNKAAVGGVIYAVCEGVFLGTFSGLVSSIPEFAGIVPMAILATIAIFVTMLVLYSTKLIAATPTFMKVMSVAGTAILVFLLTSLVLSIFGVSVIMDMFSNNILFTVGIFLFFIAYGSFMLVINFNEAQSYVENGFDKRYEWTASLGLIITIIYIYIQVVRLAMVVLSRRR